MALEPKLIWDLRNRLFRTQDFRIRDLRYCLSLSLRHTGFGIQDFEIVFVFDTGFGIRDLR